jgi:hypothetical protein
MIGLALAGLLLCSLRYSFDSKADKLHLSNASKHMHCLYGNNNPVILAVSPPDLCGRQGWPTYSDKEWSAYYLGVAIALHFDH